MVYCNIVARKWVYPQTYCTCVQYVCANNQEYDLWRPHFWIPLYTLAAFHACVCMNEHITDAYVWTGVVHMWDAVCKRRWEDSLCVLNAAYISPTSCPHYMALPPLPDMIDIGFQWPYMMVFKYVRTVNVHLTDIHPVMSILCSFSGQTLNTGCRKKHSFMPLLHVR